MSQTRRITAPLRALARPIESLTIDPANLRTHGARSIEAIAASLKRYGQQRPIVIDAEGVVIAGNGLLEAARSLGWKQVAAVRSGLTAAERIGYAIADNRTAELSGWDMPALLTTLQALGDDERLAAGFTADELESLMREEAPAEEVPAPDPREPATVKPGELWHLGKHRLMCGNSLHPETFDRLLGEERPALIATDPPYLVDYTGVRAGKTGKDWSSVYREVEIKDAAGFYAALFNNIARVMAPRAAVYCWHAHKRAGELVTAWKAAGLLDHQQIIWAKPCPVFGSVMWHFQHEPCLMGWKEGSRPHHDGAHSHTSLWELGQESGKEGEARALTLDSLTREQLLAMIRDGADLWRVSWEGGKARPVGNEHPTMKPIELFARPIRKHTRRGALCLEPFSGSGSQIIAAEQLGRRCYAVELEPVFCDVAIRRWQSLTGETATREDGAAWAPRVSRGGGGKLKSGEKHGHARTAPPAKRPRGRGRKTVASGKK